MSQKSHEDDLQFLENMSLDDTVRPKIMRRGMLKKDPSGSWKNDYVDDMDTIFYEDGAYTYICKASVGSLLDDDVWQVKRLDDTAGLVMRYANGSDDFNFAATDLATVAAYDYEP